MSRNRLVQFVLERMIWFILLLVIAFFAWRVGLQSYLAPTNLINILIHASVLGVLTIGQDHDFLTRGGLVALLVQNRRVIVEVNRLAIDGGQWRFSSHLLEIAHVSNGGVR